MIHSYYRALQSYEDGNKEMAAGKTDALVHSYIGQGRSQPRTFLFVKKGTALHAALIDAKFAKVTHLEVKNYDVFWVDEHYFSFEFPGINSLDEIVLQDQVA